MRSGTSTIVDVHGSGHILQVQQDRLLLDDHPVLTLHCTPEQVVFVSGSQEIACMPEACWYAFAGTTALPTAAEAGQYLAEHLAHWIDAQRLRRLIHALSRQVGAQGPVLMLPQSRLDPFVEAALERCESSPTLAKVTALSQVLDQPLSTVLDWLRARGKTVIVPPAPPVDPDPLEEDVATPDTEELKSDDAVSSAAKRAMFRWTPEMIAQLTTEFLAMPLDLSVSAAAKAIAERHGWPADRVEYKIHHLDLPQQCEAKLQERTQPEQRGDDVRQEDDPATSDVDSKQKLTPPVGPALVERNESHTANTRPTGPVELRRGNYVWDVQVNGAVQRWYLDYPYGTFPAQTGGDVRYNGVVYTLQLVAASTVRATSACQPGAPETEPADVLKVG